MAAAAVSTKRPVPSNIFTTFLQGAPDTPTRGEKTPGTPDSGERLFLEYSRTTTDRKGPICIEAARISAIINELIEALYLMSIMPFSITNPWSGGSKLTKAIFSATVDIQTLLWYSKPTVSGSTLPSINRVSGRSSEISSRSTLSVSQHRCKSLESSIPKIIITPPEGNYGSTLRRSRTATESSDYTWQEWEPEETTDSGLPGSPNNKSVARYDGQFGIRAPSIMELKKLRNFLKTNPDVADKLEEVYGSKRSPSCMGLIETMGDLQQQTTDRMCRTAQEDRQWRRQISHTDDLERRNLRKVEELEKIIIMETQKRNSEVFKRDARIDELQDGLQQLNDISHERIRMAREEVEQNLSELQRVSSATQMELQLELDRLHARLSEKEVEDRIIESQMRQARLHAENHLLERINLYDRDMLFKQTTLEDLSREFEREKAHLQLLERRLEAVEGDYKRILDDRQKELEQHRQRVHKLKQVFQAAVMIKTYFRNFKRIKQAERSKKHRKSGKNKSKDTAKVTKQPPELNKATIPTQSTPKKR